MTLRTNPSDAVGPIVGGVIGAVTTWRVVFAITLPFIAASLIVGLRSIQQARPVEKIRLAWGQVLLALAFVGLILGLERAGAWLAARSLATGAAGTSGADAAASAGAARRWWLPRTLSWGSTPRSRACSTSRLRLCSRAELGG